MQIWSWRMWTVSCLLYTSNHLRCFEGREIERDDRIKSMYIARKYEEYITKVE